MSFTHVVLRHGVDRITTEALTPPKKHEYGESPYSHIY